jgi:hypothetical protein
VPDPEAGREFARDLSGSNRGQRRLETLCIQGATGRFECRSVSFSTPRTLMKLPFLKYAAASSVLLAGVWLTTSAAVEGGAAVDYKFRDAPLHSLGIQSMSELRGKPIIIDFWGKN